MSTNTIRRMRVLLVLVLSTMYCSSARARNNPGGVTSTKIPTPKSPRLPPPSSPEQPPTPFPPVKPPSEYHSIQSGLWNNIFVSSNGSVIFAHDIKNLVWSSDGGELWRDVPQPEGMLINWSNLFVSKSSITMFIQYNDTLYKSYDYGATWDKISSIPCFELSPQEEKYITSSDDGNVVGAHYIKTGILYDWDIDSVLKERVCISRNGGVDWIECTACAYTNTTSTVPKPLSIPGPSNHPRTPDILLSGDGSLLVYGSRGSVPRVGGGTVVVSTDAPELMPLPLLLAPTQVSLSYNGSLFGSFNKTLFLSTDRGATLTNLTLASGAPLVPPFGQWWQYLHISADGTRLVAIARPYYNQTTDYYCESLDSGKSWTTYNPPRSEKYIPYSAATSDLSTVWAVPYWRALFGRPTKSTDYGKTIGESFTASTLQVSPNGQTVMAEDWLSRDGGSTWSRMDKYGVAMCAGGKGLIAKYNSTLYISRNSGSTWKSLVQYDDVRRVAASQKDCKRIFVVSGRNMTHISKDWGKKWSSKAANISTWCGWWFTMSASWDAKKIALTDGPTNSEIDISTDGGNTWKKRPAYPKHYSAPLFPLYSGDGSRLLVGMAYETGLLVSTDDGVSWTRVLMNYTGWYWPPTVQDQLASSYDGRIMYGVQEGKFMRSNTGGLTWEIIDFFAPYITAIGTSQDGRIVYILEAMGGIHASQDYGSSWTFTGPFK